MFKDSTLIQELKLAGVQRGILNFAKENPLVLYQIVVFLKYLSLPSFGLIIVALMANHLFLNIILMINISIIRYKTIHGALNPFGNCLYKTCSFKKFLDSNVYKDIYTDIVDNLFLRQFAMFGIRDVKLDEVVKIHVVIIDAIIDKAKAYEIPFFESHIFVGESPKKIKGFSRFMVLHEVGHCLMKVATFNYSIIAGTKTYIFFCFWALPTIVWNLNSLLLVVSLIAFLFLLKEEIEEQRKLLVLREEMIADSFALTFLSEEDLQKVAANKSIENNLNDIKRLGVIYNKVRLACLKENISLAINGNKDKVLEHMKSIVPDKLYIFVYPFILSGLIALYSFAPSYKMLLGFFVFVFILLIVYLFSFILSESLKSIINSKIKEQQVKMTKQDLIIEVLEKYFADECDIVGPTNVEKIVNGVTKVTQTHYGSDMSLTDIIVLLVPFVGFVNDVISLGKLLKSEQDMLQNALQLKESAESLESFNILPSEIKVRIGDNIYVYVLERIQEGQVES